MTQNKPKSTEGKGIKDIFNRFAGNKNCPKCHGEGNYMYDDVHGKICELCCTHPQGFKELDKEFWPESVGKEVCVFGCGAERDKKNYHSEEDLQEYIRSLDQK